MAKVTSSNLVSEPRDNVVSLISDNSNVSDPVTTSAQYRKWIYSSEPDVKSSDFSGYPYIIINPARFNPTESGSLSATKRFVGWTIDIEVVSSDRGYKNNDGKGLAHNDAITDNILQTFMDQANRQTLRNYGMAFAEPIVSDIIIGPVHNQKAYRRIITVIFDRNWIKTSE